MPSTPPTRAGAAERGLEPGGVSRRGAVIGAAAALLLAVVIGVIVLAVRNGDNPVDAWWAGVMASLRLSAPWYLDVAHALDWFGGGWRGIVAVPLVVIAALLMARRRWGALYFALATLGGAAAVQLLKGLFARERPQDMLVTSDFGSFPSGHVANAAVMALVLALLIRRAWMWVLGALYVMAMLVARTALSAHWLTDTLGGIAVAVGVVALLGAALWQPLQRERMGKDRAGETQAGV